VLQGISDRVNEMGRCYGIKANVDNTKVMKTSRQLSSIRIIIDQKQENVECFKYWDIMVINDA